MMEYRAACVGDCVLTGPEHQHLSDAELIAEAMRESARMGLDLTPEQIRIGPWTDHEAEEVTTRNRGGILEITLQQFGPARQEDAAHIIGRLDGDVVIHAAVLQPEIRTAGLWTPDAEEEFRAAVIEQAQEVIRDQGEDVVIQIDPETDRTEEILVPTAGDPGELLTAPEAAAELGVHRDTTSRAAKNSQVPGARPIGPAWVATRAAWATWYENRRPAGRPKGEAKQP